jgi:hypothetical protein
MTDRFEELLHELGIVFQMPLHPDKLNACSISIPPNPTVMLQMDESLEYLYIFSKVIEIPPGKFRENILAEALKTNGLSDPRPGTFGYIGSTNTLTIHQRFPASLLNGERLASLIGSLLESASAWKTAIEQGRPGPLQNGESSLPPGLRP